MHHAVTLSWPGGTHRFALGIGQLRAVQDVTGKGPLAVYRDLNSGDWRVDDVLAPLRHGLLGGGMDEDEMRTRMKQVTESEPLMALAPIAALVMAAALVGPGDDPAGEPTGETEPPISSNSPSSTGTARKRGLRRARSTK